MSETARPAGRGTATLAFAVRPRAVVWLVGRLMLPLAALAAVPAAVALFYGESGFAARCAAVAVACLAIGYAGSRGAAPRDVRTNETMCATALIFLIAAAAMTWPFVSDRIAPLDAWFESVSAITTTGLSTLADVESHSRGFLFARAWMQWYGGLAIVVLAVALLMEPGVAARRLSGGETETLDVVGSTRARARRALAIYVVLTLIGVAALLAAGAGPFDAVTHAFAAISTGGFSTRNASLAAFGDGVRIAATAISVLGAVSLTTYVRLWHGRGTAQGKGGWRDALRDPDLKALGVVALGAVVLVGFFMVAVGGHSLSYAAREAPMIALSAQTTSGFSTLDVGSLDPGSTLTLIGAMIVGGDIGSTAGGIKITRILVLLALIRLVILRTRLPPHAVAEPLLAGRRLNAPDVQFAVVVVGLHLATIALSWLVFVAAGADPMKALFDVVSAVGTVGLSSGLTGPDLAPGLKALLSVDMLMGRLEIVAFIVLLYPRTWFGRRAGMK